MKTAIRTNAYVCATLSLILLDGMCAVLAEPRSGIELNGNAFTFAAQLIKEGHVVADGKGDWTKHHPSVDEENDFIRLHGFSEYAKWHLGIDRRFRRIRSEDTSFRTAISKMFIGAGCLPRKPEPDNMATQKSKTRRQSYKGR